MKKLIIFLLLTGIILTVYFASCSKNDFCDCESTDFEYVKILKDNKFYNFKHYKGENGASFLSSDEILKDWIIHFKSNEFRLRDDQYVTIGWYYILNGDEYIINDFFEVTEDKLEGILVYESNGDSLFATFLKKENDAFIMSDINRLKTNYISTNDLNKICNKYLNFSIFNIISNINMEQNHRAFISYVPDELQFHVGGNGDDNPKDEYCPQPCPYQKGVCVLKETDRGPKHVCEMCKVSAVSQLIMESNITTFNNFQIIKDLYSFRDNYLLKFEGGKQLIHYYYELSAKFNHNKLDLDFAIKTFTIFSDYMPLLNNLRANPDSETILSDPDSIIVLKNYFEGSKTYFNDSRSKNQIAEIIVLLDRMSGKSNKEISTILENKIFNEN